MKFFNFFKKSGSIENAADLAKEKGFGIDTYGATGNERPVDPLALAAVFSCIRVLSESVGMLPINLYTQSGESRKKAVNHPLTRLLRIAPNDYQTPQEFKELLIQCLCLRGNFYAYKVRTLGKISELLPLNPDSVSAKLNDKYQPEYQVTFKDGSYQKLTQDDVWHVRIFPECGDGFLGVNPIEKTRRTFELASNAEEWGDNLFKNGTVTSGVLSTDQKMTDEAFDRLRKSFDERHSGIASVHRPMILEMGLDWKQMSMNAEDSQFLETRKFQKDEICSIFRVPPHMIANLERATFSNIEHQSQSFVNYSLMPYLTRIEERINIGLLDESEQGDHYAKFNAGALLRGDTKTRMESYASGIQWGIYSPNDCRALEDMNPRDGGDVYLTPMNMTTNPEAGQDDNKTAA
ncbi:phage portal protein [Endozoicomonas sp. Mp262]|uniref:phage portal protein n=1 Tax=Endozoicomonas sp. Mp262 TaxID=2919499 RepID=UPI0021D8C744